ncbi:glutathione S-transferase family protein [Rhodobacteraceae bacterium 2376]|uniref:Glutathione S-transferase family protein n=1 Tax=Rhabdonatronobacter sediminivivens TaxID=2743469 RepID=A0A7Z0KZL1_9RHOB|nr:glutathione S-transferase family protein [Rhabdonatronobacter sediminivivens]NYS26375.1 glutathione S-transferase family protein [Rhabdonatronobacter sediminivivens]
MHDLILTTFDWVPEAPRGYVRDLRARWAMEEAGLRYRIETVALQDRGAAHLAHQPFGQVPWLVDGAVSVFESGAILLHLGAYSETLLPTEPKRRADAISWLFAALNSVEPPVLAAVVFGFANDSEQTPGRKGLDAFLQGRLADMERVVAGRDWLAGAFSVADIAMVDALRVVERFAGGLDAYPACRDYIDRATARPAFVKAHGDQMAHFAAADRDRAPGSPTVPAA